MNTTDEPEQVGTISLVGPWRRMSEAPKDGTFIKVLVYHPQRRYAKKKEKNEWAAVVEARWTDFNGGGWVWSGMFGRFQGWRPNAAPERASRTEDSTP